MSVTNGHSGHELTGVRWIGAADATALRRSAYRRIIDAAARAIERRGRFLIVLAGGNTPRGVYELLRAAPTDWSRWHVYFGDERCLAPDNAGRNSRMAAGIWLEHVPIAEDQMHILPAELGAEAAARSYADTVRGVGDFDLVLLGLGEDGHTASLFPGHDWGVAPDASDALAVFDAPQPPPQRVSLSAARLSRAREVLFLVEGVSKRNAVARWRRGEGIPARSIHPHAGVDVLVESQLLCEEGARAKTLLAR
jgi:6-phosphogluconolactonase